MTGKNVPFRPAGLGARAPGTQRYSNLLIYRVKKTAVLRIQLAGDAHLPGGDSQIFRLNEEFDNESE
jgi:hypothetical protein